MSKSSRSSPVSLANQIVTNALIHTFVEEVTTFYEIVDYGEQFIIISENQVRGVFDASDNKTPHSLIETFCELFTNRSNIMVNAYLDDRYETPTLRITLQDGTYFLVQDFSTYYKKL